MAASRERVLAALERAGGKLGRYVLLEQVGAGGMGQVWRAYDPALQREVALKRILPGLAGPEVTPRLVAEARAMAQVSHRNVVDIYDAEELVDANGETTVVLVMQFVDGPHLADWIDDNEPSWREIVEVFVAAGQGLIAAHNAGLLHRDFKPGNVLMDPDGTPKVTDFGLAKASDHGGRQGLSSDVGSDDLTQEGVVMGTPRYMAPEQHSRRPLTEAADQYAFCVSLWEALCSGSPFPADWKSLTAAKRTGPPRFPRTDVPRRVARALCRGLAPRPEDRWPSMTALLAQLRAGRRIRGRLAAAGGVVAVGAVAVAGAAGVDDDPCPGAEAQLSDAWGPQTRARAERAMTNTDASYADAVWSRTSAELDRYAGDWATMHRQACEATRIRGVQSATVLDLRMRCLREAKVSLRAVTSELETGRPEVLRNAHHLLGSLPAISRCDDIEALSADVEPPMPGEAETVEQIEGLLAEARAARIAVRFEAAGERLGEAQALADSIRYEPVQADLALSQGLLAEREGDYEVSERHLVRSLRIAAARQLPSKLSLAAGQLAYVVGYAQHRTAEGLRYGDLARAAALQDPEFESTALSHTALVLQAQGELEAAEQMHRRAIERDEFRLGSDDVDITDAWTSYAATLELQGRYEEAGRYHDKTLKLRRRVLGDEHPDVALSHGNMGTILYAQGKFEEAENAYREALEILAPALGSEHMHVATMHNNLANALQAQRRNDEAEQEHRRALSSWAANFGEDHPHTTLSRVNLAACLNYQKKHEAAERELRRALRVWQAELPTELHRKVAVTYSNLSLALRGQGALVDAEAQQRRAIEIQRALDAEHADMGAYRTQLALILQDQGKRAAARAEFEGALALRRRVLPADHPLIRETRDLLNAL